MKRYFGQLSFKGTDFHGWQNQPNANTVQATIELAISQLFSKKHLILMYESKKYKELETPTSRGILINKKDAEKYCIKKILINN